jgi:predicted nucleotidyltransferase
VRRDECKDKVNKEEMRLKFGVIRIGLFESYARESEKKPLTLILWWKWMITNN